MAGLQFFDFPLNAKDISRLAQEQVTMTSGLTYVTTADGGAPISGWDKGMTHDGRCEAGR
jgi:hypothetical protein